MFRTVCILLLCLLAVPALANTMAPQLEQLRQQYRVGAVSWAMVEDNAVVELGGLGFHSNNQQRPVTPDSLFRVGSLTKLITALSLNMLAEQGKLDLDAPLKTYLPDAPLHNRFETPVTLRMMLEHSAGLQDLTSTEFNYPAPLSLTDAFQVAPQARKTEWPPGLHQSYSNVGAGYAGLALEQVTDESWDSWVSANIFTPLQMPSSSTLHTQTLQQQLVTGYDTDRKTPIPYWHTLFRPFGALNTTARDFSQLLKLLIQRGQYNDIQLITPATLTRMERPQMTYAASLGHRYGYGAGIYRWYRNQQPLLGHGGDGDGYLAHFAYNPDSKRGIFVVINAFHHPALRAMRKPLESWVIEPLPAPALPTTTPTQAELKPLIGRWQAVTHRFPGRNHSPALVTIESNAGQLFYREEKQRTELIPVSKGTFRERHEGGASHLFFERQGQWYWQSDLGNYRRLD